MSIRSITRRCLGIALIGLSGLTAATGANAQQSASASSATSASASQSPAVPLTSFFGARQGPEFVVDASWPKPLPNNWILGQVGGMAVDRHDHIWINQRPRSSTADEVGASAASGPRSACCIAAPSVMEFDQQGNLLQAWGGPGYVPQWPNSEHGIWVDKEDNVWIGGNGAGDRAILKFSNSGQLLLVIGTANDLSPENNQDTTKLGQPAGIEVDEAAHEVYIADGYLNKRIAVYDSRTGVFKRGWGAYGQALSTIDNATPPPYVNSGTLDRQFRNPVHCAHLSDDGYLYVCDRVNDRIQVFTKQGTFVKEFFVRPATLGNGSVWTINFSNDRRQRYLLVADGENNVVWVLDRDDGTLVSTFGHNGRNAGYFHWVHQAAVTSDGNYYTGEVDTGKRIQKFVPRGDRR